MEHVLLTLFKSLSKDLISASCTTDGERRAMTLESRRDYQYALSRLDKEGPEFLTKASPAFAKHLLACIEAGSYTPIPGFRTGRRGCLPAFLSGWTTRIFSQCTGSVLDSICPHAIWAIRQLTLFASKAKALPEPEVCTRAFLEYKEDDDAINQESLWSTSISTFGYTLETSDQHYTVDRKYRSVGDLGRLFIQCGRAIGTELDRWYNSCTAIGRTSTRNPARPKHGPGAVAERLDEDGKWRFISSSRFHRLDGAFDTFRYCYLEDAVGTPQQADTPLQEYHPSRLIAVPKTSVAPRLIAAEPCANQYWQQMLMGILKDGFDRTWIGKSIDISDQTRSQQRAVLGSTDLSLGTIDLSKASDSVTLDHVGALFHHDSSLLHALMSCRTETIDIPDIGLHRLRKFASMGSAVCFPIESAVFLAAVAASIFRQRGQRFTSARMVSVCREVTVYGDDIVAPSRYVPGIMSDLRELGFIPNTSKSYWRSHFREACGVDVYKGVPVKPVYIRVDFWSRHVLTDEDVVSLVDTSRQLCDVGLYGSAELLLEKCLKHLGSDIPFSIEPTGHLSHNLWWRTSNVRSRWNESLHRLEQLVYTPVAKSEVSNLDGYARLLRFLVTRPDRDTDPMSWIPDNDWDSKPTRGFNLKRKFA
jgi:hypothetical protein